MKFLYSFVLILVFTFLGELLNYFLPLPIPASIWGLLLLFAALRLGLVKLEKIESLGNTMIGLLPLLFVPPVVNLLGCWDVVRQNLAAIMGIIFLSTIIIFGLSGKLSQLVIDRKGADEDA